MVQHLEYVLESYNFRAESDHKMHLKLPSLDKK